MNKRKTLLTIIVIVLLSSCEPIATFNEPQPVETDNLTIFPKRLQGKYLSIEDNYILTINDRLIQRTFDGDDKIHINELDSTEQLIGDTIINLETNQKTPVKRESDSLLIHKHYVDTMFQINYDNVVRKFKGYYFLSKRYEKESWEVMKVKLTRGELTISRISEQQDIENLSKITETPKDTIAPINFKATRKQFKKFIRTNGFRAEDRFIRQK